MTRRKLFFAKALARLVFIDETSTNTRLTKRGGWSAILAFVLTAGIIWLTGSHGPL